MFASVELAEDVLIELWTKNDYTDNNAPIAVYKCEDCGYYHLTSRGPMNSKLASLIGSDKFKIMKEANRWLDKWKKK